MRVSYLTKSLEFKNKERDKIKFWLTIANTDLDTERTNCQLKVQQLDNIRKTYISNRKYYESQPEFQTESDEPASIISESMDQS